MVRCDGHLRKISKGILGILTPRFRAISWIISQFYTGKNPRKWKLLRVALDGDQEKYQFQHGSRGFPARLHTGTQNQPKVHLLTEMPKLFYIFLTWQPGFWTKAILGMLFHLRATLNR